MWSGYRLLHTVFAAHLGTEWQEALQKDPACILARFSTRHGWGRALARLSLASHCNIWGHCDCEARGTRYMAVPPGKRRVHDLASRVFLAGCFILEHKQGELPSWLSLIECMCVCGKGLSLILREAGQQIHVDTCRAETALE